MIPPWAKDYVGIPCVLHGRDRAGCDCWGLVRMVLAERFGVTVPEYLDLYPTEKFDALPHGVEAKRGEWIEIAPDKVNPGDLVVIYIKGEPVHVGMMLDAAGVFFLHVMKGCNSVVEMLAAPKWAKRRKEFFRHPQLA